MPYRPSLPTLGGIFILLCLPGVAALALPMLDPSLRETTLVSPAFMTKNSVRRDPVNDDEVSSILQLSMGCTGFLVANREGRYFMGTARHCFHYELAQACQQNHFKAVTAVGQQTAACRRVVVANPQDDLAIVELAFPNAPKEFRERLSFLTLASYEPRPWNRLRMIGYPTDEFREGSLTVTENCWDNTGFANSYRNHLPNRETRDFYHFKPNTPEGRLRPLHRWHNCATWGGNSGGPMILEDTTEVVGIPDAYEEKKIFYQATDSAVYETTAGFVARNRAALDAAGVEITETPGADYRTHFGRTERALRKAQSRD